MSAVLDLIRPDLEEFRPYASARRTAPAGRIRLDANESPWPPFAGGRGLNRYPEPQPTALRQRLAGLYGIPAERLLLTRGSDEAMDVLCRGFCRAGQDSVVVVPPSFGMYEICARIQGAGVRRVPLDADDDFALDADAVLAACDRSVKLVFLCSPNNPTGQVVAPGTVRAICEALAGRALVVLDEAYVEFAHQPSLVSSAHSLFNLVVLRTLSKARGLAGARVGALAGPPELVSFLQGLLPPYPLPAPAARAALRALRPLAERLTRRRIARVRRERERMAASLAGLAAVERVYPSQANFLLVRFRDASTVLAACRDAGIVLRDMSDRAGLDQCLRITVGRRADNVRLFDTLATL